MAQDSSTANQAALYLPCASSFVPEQSTQSSAVVPNVESSAVVPNVESSAGAPDAYPSPTPIFQDKYYCILINRYTSAACTTILDTIEVCVEGVTIYDLITNPCSAQVSIDFGSTFHYAGLIAWSAPYDNNTCDGVCQQALWTPITPTIESTKYYVVARENDPACDGTIQDYYFEPRTGGDISYDGGWDVCDPFNTGKNSYISGPFDTLEDAQHDLWLRSPGIRGLVTTASGSTFLPASTQHTTPSVWYNFPTDCPTGGINERIQYILIQTSGSPIGQTVDFGCQPGSIDAVIDAVSDATPAAAQLTMDGLIAEGLF